MHQKNGHLNCLRYLHENGAPWNEISMIRASSYGHLECLKYLHENGCPWNEDCRLQAITNGHFECLKYLNEVEVIHTNMK